MLQLQRVSQPNFKLYNTFLTNNSLQILSFNYCNSCHHFYINIRYINFRLLIFNVIKLLIYSIKSTYRWSRCLNLLVDCYQIHWQLQVWINVLVDSQYLVIEVLLAEFGTWVKVLPYFQGNRGHNDALHIFCTRKCAV